MLPRFTPSATMMLLMVVPWLTLMMTLTHANPLLTNNALVMTGNFSLQALMSRPDRRVMYIAVDKNDDPCSVLIPDHNPVCVYCLNGACDNLRRGQKKMIVAAVDSMFCRIRYRIITLPHPQAHCMAFLRRVKVYDTALLAQPQEETAAAE